MKKLILTCSFITATCIISFGQTVEASRQNGNGAAQATARQSATPETIAARKARTYQKQLGLTEEQYKGIYNAELNYAQQYQMARANGGNGPGPGQAMQMQMGKDQRFKSILTADQYAKYEAAKPKASTASGTN